MDSLLQFLLIGFFPLLIFLIYMLFWRPGNTKIKTGDNKIAPEAAGAWPVIGHLHLLVGRSIPHITLGDMADKYGPAFTIRLGMRRALVISSRELAEECFTTKDRVFATRSKSVAVKLMGYNYAMFSFTPYGSYWREVRKIAMLELLSNRRLEMLKHVRVSEVETSMKELYEVWLDKDRSTGPGQRPVLVDMKRWLGDLTLNIVVRMVIGKRYFGTINASDEREAQRFQKAIRDFFHFIGLFAVSDALPFLEWLDLQGYESDMKRTAKELDSLLERFLEDHKQKRVSSEYKGEEDFMDVMLSTLEDTNLTGYDADTINKATSLNLILGGSDTTVVTLTWILSLLLNNRNSLKRAQDELDKHVGRDRQVDESDIKNLEYLQAIVKETLRLYPAAPLAASHEAMEDCTLAGYHVPAGTRLVPNLWKIQRDPRVWSDPSDFRPERFLTSHAHLDVRGQNFEYIPFGSGRRSCPGISFALQVVHLTLASLLHGFELATLLDAPVDMTESAGLINLKATPLEILVSPRLPAKLYGY